MSAPSPVTVITGASAGIGFELAKVFARNGHRLVLVARRKDKLNALADEIAASGQPKPDVIALDLSAAGVADNLTRELASRNLEAAVMINNAGFGLTGHAAELPRAEQLAMIDLNVRALTELSLAFVDSLARHQGGILNVASLASFLPAPGMAVYYATKAYVLSFSEALHVELRKKGVRVTALCPGPVPTEFQARAGLIGPQRGSLIELSASEVAEAGYKGFAAGKRLVVPGRLNKLVPLMPRIFPRALILMASGVRQRRRKT
ncbi:MAG TPA: SDR family oxidoreductase [Pseudorhodoplanes sp.]|nr:SDR family oxidoreductase [Pseudorhodoplanes sp.]